MATRSRRTKRDYEIDYSISLGRGNFGEVFSCELVDGSGARAMKCINISNDIDQFLENLANNEIRILSMLNHDCIIRYDGHYKQTMPPRICIATELVLGGNLEQRIVRKTHYTEAMGRDIFRQILRVVEYIHGLNVVHGDLKPENFLMASENSDTDIKLIDFGFSQIAEGCTLTTKFGTPCYMAPELFSDQDHGKPVDMWALGALLFYLLSGKHAFPHDTVPEVSRAVREDEVQFPAEGWDIISRDAQDLIFGLLRKDMTRRLTISDAIRHPWFAASDIQLGLPLDAHVNMAVTKDAPKLLGPANWVLYGQRFAKKYRLRKQQKLEAKQALCNPHDESNHCHIPPCSLPASCIQRENSRPDIGNIWSMAVNDIGSSRIMFGSTGGRIRSRSVSPAPSSTADGLNLPVSDPQELSETAERELRAIGLVYERYSPREWDMVRLLPESSEHTSNSSSSLYTGEVVSAAPAGIGLIRNRSSTSNLRQTSGDVVSAGLPRELVSLAKYSAADLPKRLVEIEGLCDEGDLVEVESVESDMETHRSTSSAASAITALTSEVVEVDPSAKSETVPPAARLAGFATVATVKLFAARLRKKIALKQLHNV